VIPSLTHPVTSTQRVLDFGAPSSLFTIAATGLMSKDLLQDPAITKELHLLHLNALLILDDNVNVD
jgi:predicted nicotinamide N-methyase